MKKLNNLLVGMDARERLIIEHVIVFFLLEKGSDFNTSDIDPEGARLDEILKACKEFFVNFEFEIIESGSPKIRMTKQYSHVAYG